MMSLLCQLKQYYDPVISLCNNNLVITTVANVIINMLYFYSHKINILSEHVRPGRICTGIVVDVDILVCCC